jgi:hypothetical protein
MHPGIPLAYAARHIYAPNADPYRASTASTTQASSKQRRRRRRSAAFLLPRRPRVALPGRRAAAGR